MNKATYATFKAISSKHGSAKHLFEK